MRIIRISLSSNEPRLVSIISSKVTFSKPWRNSKPPRISYNSLSQAGATLRFSTADHSGSQSPQRTAQATHPAEVTELDGKGRNDPVPLRIPATSQTNENSGLPPNGFGRNGKPATATLHWHHSPVDVSARTSLADPAPGAPIELMPTTEPARKLRSQSPNDRLTRVSR